MNIEYRKMKKRDYNRVKELIIEAWFSEYDFSKRIIKSYANAYLQTYLADSNYRMVAVDNGNVVAFLLGKHRKINFFVKHKHLFLLFWIKLGLLFTKPGRRKLKILAKTDDVNNRLFMNHKDYLFNELALFIVDKKYQGIGIGTKLEKDFSNYLTARGERYMYLYSDTYSNYHFYENKGYIRGGELVVDFEIEGEKEYPLPIYFIYYKQL